MIGDGRVQILEGEKDFVGPCKIHDFQGEGELQEIFSNVRRRK